MTLPRSKRSSEGRRGGARTPKQLDLCRGCRSFIEPKSEICHFCGADVTTVNAAYYEKLVAARKAAFEVDLLLRRMARLAKKQASE